MVNRFFLIFCASAVFCPAAEDSQTYYRHLLQHPAAEVQQQVQRYQQGLCPFSDILIAEENLLRTAIQTSSPSLFAELGKKLICNLKEQLKLAEKVPDIPDSTRIRLRQKIYELEAGVLYTE